MNKIVHLKKQIIYFSLLVIFQLLFISPLFSLDIYWENPKVVSSDEIAFPTTIHQNNKAFVFWQEIDSKNSQIWLSARVYENDVSFYENKRFAGPFEYHGEVPDIYSVTNNKIGRASCRERV